METGDRETLHEALAADDVVGMADQLGFSVEATPVEGPALRAWGLTEEMVDGVGDLRVLAAESGCRVLHLRGAGPWKEIRRLMLAVHRASPEAMVWWWWSSDEAWTAAMVEETAQGRKRVKKMVLERDHPDEVGCQQWLALSPERRVDDGIVAGADGWRDHVGSVLDQDGVTRDFFERFSDGLDRLVETLEKGPEDEEARHDVVLSTLLRVVFLYFLQVRGALDGDRRFVIRQFRDPGRTGSFYRSVLRPLFFGALNRPADLRDEEAKEMGDLPFLNGGLFEPSAVEEAHPEMDWPDEVWSELLEGLFERYRFAVEWSDDDDLCRAVDPEMLGKVFEGLMYGDRRRTSGSFYTPREVVRSMVGDSIVAWLVDETGLEPEDVERLVDGRAGGLTADQRRRTREALAGLSVLDPAVGTGAFLLEVLRMLRRVFRGLDRAEGVVRTPGERYDRMRRIVHDHICGVDIQPTAVRLCELRIWLAMLAALPKLPADEMPPLPNLSHRLCTGNSLLDPLDWVRFRVDDEVSSFGRRPPRWHRRAVERLATLQRAYTRSHGAEKRELKASLDSARRSVERELLASRLRRLRRRREPYEALEQSARLFGDATQLDAGQRADKERIEREIEALEKARDDLEAGRRSEPSFSFDAHFAPVMARGGFDIVVTNPPWVRANRIDGSTRKLYRARYRCTNNGLWSDASRLGIRATFGAQVDMAGLFLERSLELLRPGGRLCALVPVKLFRSLYGAGVRGVLSEHHIEYIEDRSEDGEAMFDATTYPSVVRVRKCAPAANADEEPVEVNVWRRNRRTPSRFRASVGGLGVYGDDVREPWMLVEPSIRRIFRTMQEASVPLGCVESMPIRGGVKTGCNDAFLMSEDEAKSRFSPEVRRRWLRWAIRGRDIDEASVDCGTKLIWPVDETGEIAESLPGELEAYFEERRDRLQSRSDYRDGPIWTLFRRHDDIEDPGVVWRDMGEQLEAASIGGDAIAMNTVYYLPAPSDEGARAVVELFHSEPMRAIAFAIAERARGGWRRHFAWVMRLLPIPRTWLARLDDGRVASLQGAESIRQAYGLTRDDVDRLAGWRRDVAGTECRGAA